jgi:murein DD-endopeptidase MepM/ murein hydrolase activator NlpD
MALHLALVNGVEEPSTSYFPVAEGRVSSQFGLRSDPFHHISRFHSGIDIAAKEGSEVRSVGAGIVAFSGKYRGFGNIIVIEHGRNITTHYAHCLNTQVDVGERVSRGALIGFVGQSGRATGPHLHFELRHHGLPVNPNLILKGISR